MLGGRSNERVKVVQDAVAERELESFTLTFQLAVECVHLLEEPKRATVRVFASRSHHRAGMVTDDEKIHLCRHSAADQLICVVDLRSFMKASVASSRTDALAAFARGHR